MALNSFYSLSIKLSFCTLRLVGLNTTATVSMGKLEDLGAKEGTSIRLKTK